MNNLIMSSHNVNEIIAISHKIVHNHPISFKDGDKEITNTSKEQLKFLKCVNIHQIKLAEKIKCEEKLISRF